LTEDRVLAEFCHTIFSGVTVGIDSIILLFVSGAQILFQCAFECTDADSSRLGHGEDASTSPILFGCLNHVVEAAEIDHENTLTLNFDDGMCLRIIPERNGLESYVVTTHHGIFPITVS